MAKVGNIMARHNGANVAVADIYDSKISSSRLTFTDSNTLCAVRVDDVQGVIGETSYQPIYYKNNTETSALDYITADNAKYDFALEFNAADYNFLSAGPSFIGGSSYWCEGWFWVDTTADSDSGTFFSYAARSGANVQLIRSMGYSYTKENGVVIPKINTYDVPTGTLDSPVHIAYQWIYKNNSGGAVKTHYYYCNGQLLYSNATSTTSYWISGTIDGVLLGVYQKSTHSTSGNYYVVSRIGPYLTGSVSEFKMSKGIKYSGDNFTPPSVSLVSANCTVGGNIPIRHNNTTYYAPLVTTANQPCIAVRHNNQTYYTVRS